MPPLLPRLTNRGPAGLLSRLPAGIKRVPLPASFKIPLTGTVEINKIIPALQDLVVSIDSLVHDPENARLHPERNMAAIKQSLIDFGQVKPIVVRTETRVVMAGNGTMQAARELGWTLIAASFVEGMTEAQAAAYGLADNRTSELAKWDFEVVARLDKLIQEGGQNQIGWSEEELTVLRTDWSAFPGASSGEDEGDPDEVDVQPGDAELLMQLKVTIADPETKVEHGEIYRVGDHFLVIADVVKDVPLWMPLLKDNMLFAPYPGPLLPLTLAGASGKSILMVQPDTYIAGHILDHYKTIIGLNYVSLWCSPKE